VDEITRPSAVHWRPFFNPGVESGLSLSGQPQVRAGDTLEGVMIVLRHPEDDRALVRCVPGNLGQAHHAGKAGEIHTK